MNPKVSRQRTRRLPLERRTNEREIRVWAAVEMRNELLTRKYERRHRKYLPSYTSLGAYICWGFRELYFPVSCSTGNGLVIIV